MESNKGKKGLPFNLNIVGPAIVSLAVAIGIYVRFKGIGKWPLAVDEYFLAQAVRNILEHGLPQFEAGGYYTRGILFQYIAAPFLSLFSSDEFWLRSISVVFNLLTIPPLYLLGKKISGLTGACLLVVIFSFSLWEIEYSRFARMYTSFQAVFIWFIYIFYRVYIEKDFTLLKWLYLISFISIFIHEFGILLVLINYLPVLVVNGKNKAIHLIVCTGLLAFAYGWLSIDFRFLGAERPALPVELSNSNDGGFLLMPVILLFGIPLNSQWMLFSVLPISLTGFALFKLLTANGLNWLSRIALSSIVLFSLFNMLGLALALIALSGLLNIINYKSTERTILRRTSYVVGFNSIFWLIYGLANSGRLNQAVNMSLLTLKKVLVVLLKYPDILEQIIYPWLFAIPGTAIMSAVIILLGMIGLLKQHPAEATGFKIMLSLVLIFGLFLGLLNTKYHETRYSFFLYPLILLLVTDSICRWSKIILGNGWKYVGMVWLVGLIYFISGEDFSLLHVKNIDSPEINFRLVYNKHRANHFYTREDYRTPAVLVNENLESGQIVITTVSPSAYYLKDLDYFFIDKRGSEFTGRAVDDGSRELWTFSKLISEEKHLWAIINNHPSTVWVITNSEKSDYLPEMSKKINEKFKSYLFGTSIDGKINVYRVGKK